MKRPVTRCRVAGGWLARAARAVAAVLLLGAALSPASAEEAAGAPAESLGANSRVVPIGEPGPATANAGFVVTATSVVVIGVPESAEAAARWLEAIRAVTPKPVSHVIVTGYQPDQADGLAVLKGRGAAIVARRGAGAAAMAPDAAASTPPADAPAGDAPAGAAPATTAPDALPRQLVADLWLDDTTDLLFGGVHLVALALGPVRSPHDLAVALPEEGVVYAGELYVGGRLPDVRDADAAAWVQALAELEGQGAAVVVPARGPVSRSPQEDLSRLRDYLLTLRDTMAEAARRQTPFDEANAAVDWSRWAELPAFERLHRANARHAYLQARSTPD